MESDKVHPKVSPFAAYHCADRLSPSVTQSVARSPLRTNRSGFLTTDAVVGLVLLFAVIATATTAQVSWHLNHMRADDVHRGLDVVENIQMLTTALPSENFTLAEVAQLAETELRRSQLPNLQLTLEVEPVETDPDKAWVLLSMSVGTDPSIVRCHNRWLCTVSEESRPESREVWYSNSRTASQTSEFREPIVEAGR